MTPTNGASDRSLVERIVDLGVVPILLIISLFLPPASLGQRLFNREGTVVDASGGVVSGPAGSQMTIPAGAASGKVRLAYTAVQTAGVSAASSDRVYAASLGAAGVVEVAADSPEGQAIAQMPPGGIVFEPFYSVKSLGKETPSAAQITVPLPNELVAVEKADLYVWDGESWHWQPSHPSDDLLYLETALEAFPALLAVTQSKVTTPEVGVGLDDAADASDAVNVENISVPGCVIGDDLSIVGAASPTKSEGCLALVSNRVAGVLRSDLVDNMLIEPATRSAHVQEIVTKSAAFDGVDLDYLGVDPALRSEFTAFVQELAEALHAQSARLVVRVAAPATDGVHWDTGAFDWRAIGKAADRVRIPALSALEAYAPNGDMDLMLSWAVGEVDRHKIELLTTAQALDVSPAGETLVPYSKALGVLARNVRANQPVDLLMPGERLSFGATPDNTGDGVDYDPDAQVYYFDYQGDDDVVHTMYLQTASSVARKLQYVSRYALAGFGIDGALSPLADDDVLPVVESRDPNAVPVTAPQFAVVWTVTDPDGRQVGKEIAPLANPNWTWTAPNNPGGYVIGVALSDDGGQTAAQPVVELNVTVPTPTPMPTPEPTPTAAPEPTPAVEPDQDLALLVKFVEDVTVKDNTQFEKGEAFTKTWRLQNSGTVSWPEDTALVYESGEDMAEVKSVPVGAVAPGANVDISVDMKTPDKDAAVSSRWALQSANGAFKGGSVFVLIRAGEQPVAAAAAPAAPAAPAGAAPVARAGNVGGYFGYGIQAHIDGDMGQIFGQVNALGFNWVKQQVEWFRYNPGPGQYDWGHLDRIVDTASAHGVNVLFSVVKAPGWARPPGDTDEGPPADPNTYGTFMRELAARYKGRVKAYEIWNEQNLYYEWGGRGGKLNAGKYIQLLAAAYNAVKSVDPGAVVISGALTPTGLTDWDIAVDDAVYLEEMYKAGLARYCDAVGAHPSGYNNPPDAQWNTWSDPSAPSFKGHRSFFFRSTMEQYRNIMVKYGDGHKRIWPTEFGWATVEGLGVGPAEGYGYAGDNSEAEQAQYIVRAYEMARSWGFVGPMFLWNLNFAPVAGNRDEKAAFGIVRGDWAPRPAFSALQNMPK